MENRKNETELFEQKPVLEAIARLAIPTVVGQIILVIYNMADTFFIGLTGSDAMITSVTVCMPAFMFLSAIANLFGVGGSSVISRALGIGDLKRTKAASSFAFWGCLAVTLVYSLAAWLMLDVFIDLLGGTDPLVHDYSYGYLMYTVVIGGIATSMNMLMSHLVRSEGHSVQASIGIALGGIMNICLDPLFMFVLLAPGNETMGAAIATSLSNLIAFLYFAFILLIKRSKNSALSFRPEIYALKNHIPADILAAGLPACLMTLFENISYAVLDKLMSLNGTAMQAGIGVAKKVNMLAHCIVRGIAQGVLPLIGYNFSSGNHKRMRSSILTSTTLAVVMASLCTVGCLLFNNQLIALFIQNTSDSVVYGARFLAILCLGGPFSACAYSFISFFQATGKGMRSFLLAILRKGVLDIPMMFLLNRIFPIYGIVWATPITDFICCIVSVAFFISFLCKYTNTMKSGTKHHIFSFLHEKA